MPLLFCSSVNELKTFPGLFSAVLLFDIDTEPFFYYQSPASNLNRNLREP